jgi:NADPH-dependent 2,4-dienoyl-CoA reductase/sulfur reductase-like enzyme
MKRLVVVGADAAGMSAAHQALRRSGGTLDVVVLERTRHTSYSACGIPYWIAGDVDAPEELVARTAAEHRELGVDLRLGVNADGIDLDRREVRAGGARIPFDELVLATGAHPVLPAWARDGAGSLIPGVHPVKNLDDGATWLSLIEPGRRAVVVGGGYIGLEMAEALVRRGMHVSLVTRHEMMSSLDRDMGARIRESLTAAGITVLPDTTVDGLRLATDGSVAGVVADDRVLPADVVVLGLGLSPATELGAAAGLPLGEHGGYLPDERQWLAEGVWAAGDCCEARDRMTGGWAYTPLGTHANKQGRVAGDNLAGGNARFGGVLGTAITRFAAAGQHVEVARTGLSSALAAAAGFDVAALVTEGRTASGYMPEAAPIATKVLADRRTRRLLGMQLVGGRGAGKRIDTAAAALWAELTVDDLAGMDLAYAPPFATAWEAVQLAARRLADRM